MGFGRARSTAPDKLQTAVCPVLILLLHRVIHTVFTADADVRGPISRLGANETGPRYSYIAFRGSLVTRCAADSPTTARWKIARPDSYS